MIDSDLIDRARHGDDAAWESLVREHQEGVFRLAYLLTHDPDEAADVAQETFIRAFHGLGRFDASRPLRPWLLRIARNAAHNRRRAASRYRAALERSVRRSPGGGVDPSAERVREEAEQAEVLWEAVRQLKRRDQEAIYLRHFLELSVAETAEALQVAPGTVKSRLHRALKRLRAVVERDYPTLSGGGLTDG